MKRVLIASFYFPPYADISGVRAFKFCKFLPEFGWEPWVLTVNKHYYGDKITSTVPKKLECIRQYRLPYLPVPAAKTFASLIYPLYLLFFILKNRKYLDAVHMIGSPFHPFLLTPIISAFLKIPTSLDFRDSWSYNFGFDGQQATDISKRTRLKNFLFYKIEKLSLQYASFATFATSVLLEEYSALIPELLEKYHTIFNGYDRDDFLDINPVSVTDKKTIILAGKFHIYTPDAVRYFLETLKELPDITFLYIGNEGELIKSLARELDVSDQVVVMGYQPYDQVLQFIAGSDYCLLSNGLKNGMGTKIFDYMALGKPILCLVPQESIIAREFSGIPNIIISQSPHSRMSIKKSIQKLLSQKEAGQKSISNKFTRKNGAEQLASLLSENLPHKHNQECC